MPCSTLYYYSNALILLLKIMLCNKLHCQKVFQLESLFLYDRRSSKTGKTDDADDDQSDAVAAARDREALQHLVPNMVHIYDEECMYTTYISYRYDTYA